MNLKVTFDGKAFVGDKHSDGNLSFTFRDVLDAKGNTIPFAYANNTTTLKKAHMVKDQQYEITCSQDNNILKNNKITNITKVIKI